MAINIKPCAVLTSGQDNSCSAPRNKFEQTLILINQSDIASYTVENTEAEGVCKKHLKFKLKTGKKGFPFVFSNNSSAIFGSYSMTPRDISAQPQYQHIINVAVTDLTEEEKCTIEALASGKFIGVIRRGEHVDVYGIVNGLSAGDYTADPQANAGYIPLTLQSKEDAQEPNVPMAYKSEVAGQELEDFDSLFEVTA